MQLFQTIQKPIKTAWYNRFFKTPLELKGGKSAARYDIFTNEKLNKFMFGFDQWEIEKTPAKTECVEIISFNQKFSVPDIWTNSIDSTYFYTLNPY